AQVRARRRRRRHFDRQALPPAAGLGHDAAPPVDPHARESAAAIHRKERRVLRNQGVRSMQASDGHSRAEPAELLSASELAATTEWLAWRQKPSGEIPWADGLKMDPWDHVHSAMGLCAMGRAEAAQAAYRYMVATQDDNGGWAAERRGGKVTRITQESNHAA